MCQKHGLVSNTSDEWGENAVNGKRSEGRVIYPVNVNPEQNYTIILDVDVDYDYKHGSEKFLQMR